MPTLVQKFLDAVQHLLDDVEKNVLSFFDSLATSIASNGGAVLLSAALKAVEAAETTGGTGQEKFEAAKASVIATLKEQGLPIIMNAVHGAIEAAVAQQKAQTA